MGKPGAPDVLADGAAGVISKYENFSFTIKEYYLYDEILKGTLETDKWENQ